ncbi:hypothetical protein [Streptomyces mirabilis]|uniref:hypothetical protein n=1 Tax=Streptomyces mirabilis TaxID=68239 RepID=UPI003679C3A7
MEIEETRPWHADGVIWPAVRVTYPDTFAVPSKQQMLYFDGIIVPTRRRVYVRNPDGTRVTESTSLVIDIEDARFL